MTGNFQLDSIQQVLQAIERIPPGKTSVLDDLSREAAQVLANCSDKKFYEQGYVLADWLRQKLDMENNAKTDPRALLDSWQIESKDITGLDENLEAVACWGKQHGPAVLVNREGRYSRNPAGRNAALAHEICHLLADRHGALPLVEVLGGRVPKGTEQRANAFAAEFLLPRSQAAVAAKDFTRQEAPLLQQLGRQYGVSHHVAANQVLNSAARSGLDDNVRTFLERYRRDLWL
ncbi:MAG: ImmA/IrrE family metallo-endopeptidase [Gammaproteobacteria bacterium]|nr:ImmA/IrrE family metallo-endopeptidase [Gammaproteobacteria bacterium]